jgi:hypothetical protein
METLVELNSTSKRARVVVRLGDTVMLRATLPPLSAVRHARAVTTLLEALSLWTDGRLCVALSAGSLDDCFRFELADELGVGARSVYYAVEVVKRAPRRRRTPDAPAQQLRLEGAR